MMRSLRLLGFQVRQFAGVPYFTQLMLLTTMTTTLVQWLGFHAWGAITPTQGWVRGAVIGMWTTATCAAGIIGFERYKGTLVFLVIAPIGALRALAIPVLAAASFSLLAFPTAWGTWAFLERSLPNPSADASWLSLIAGVAMLALGCSAIALTIAAVFVLTPNAISYEGLLVVPILMLSGVLFTASEPPAWIAVASAALPLRLPVRLLLGQGASSIECLIWALCVLAWFGAAGIAAKRCLRKATIDNTLEVV